MTYASASARILQEGIAWMTLRQHADAAITRHEDGSFTEVDEDGNDIGYGDWRDEPLIDDDSDYAWYYARTYPNLARAIPWETAHETTKNRIRRESNRVPIVINLDN